MTGQSPTEPEPTGPADAPVLRIVSGNPSPDELAAVTAVLAAVASARTAGDRPPPAGAWADLSLRLRRPLPAGPGAWTNSVWS